MQQRLLHWIKNRRHRTSADDQQTTAHRGDKSKRGRSERGAAMVELALIAVPLAMLSMGAFEMGLAYQDSLTYDQASRAGARATAMLARDVSADREALESALSALGPEELDQLDLVIIYESDATGAIPTNCDNPSVPSPAGCNRFEPDSFTELENDGLWGCGPAAYDRNWCPSTRLAYLETPVYVGVTLIANHEFMSGLMPTDSVTIKGTTVMRVNPITGANS